MKSLVLSVLPLLSASQTTMQMGTPLEINPSNTYQISSASSQVDNLHQVCYIDGGYDSSDYGYEVCSAPCVRDDGSARRCDVLLLRTEEN